MATTIEDKFNQYLDLNKKITELKKTQNEYKKILLNIEQDIQNYMIENNMDSISLNGGQIVLYERKQALTFKKETMTDKIVDELKCNQDKATKLAESIITNKVFNVVQKIKANIKK